MTKLVVVMIAIGLIAGHLTSGSIHIPEYIEFAAFSVMLFGVGLELGKDTTLWQRLRQGGWKMILFPLNVVLGSWLGGLIAGFALGLPINQTIAIASGFGWYSLAAILLNELDGPKLAAIAFIANVLREFLSFIMIPWVAKLGDGLVAAAIGGATSMDTTLPIVSRCTNSQAALFAFVSGVITSTLVPIFIPLWMHL